MEPYTLNRNFLPQDVIDGFSSMIWTERYYGDSEVELVAPTTSDIIQKLPVGTFLTIKESDEIMILETADIDEGKLKVTGISLLKWLNNRFVRAKKQPEDLHWALGNVPAGQHIWNIVYNMCCLGSPYLNGTIDTGVTNPQRLVIPNLTLDSYDASGGNLDIAVPYGPLYDAIREIANTNKIGMKIYLASATDVTYSLKFKDYKGTDRTSAQNVRPIIRFSPQMESFTNIKELQSIAAFKTLIYVFAPYNPGSLAPAPGVADLGAQYSGFDLRALQVFADDITTDQVSGNAAKLKNMLINRAKDQLTKNHYIQAVDGEIVPDSQFMYGRDYYLGDLIEVQGNSGVIGTATITEYIRSQDESGEKAYPTVTMTG